MATLEKESNFGDLEKRKEDGPSWDVAGTGRDFCGSGHGIYYVWFCSLCWLISASLSMDQELAGITYRPRPPSPFSWSYDRCSI